MFDLKATVTKGELYDYFEEVESWINGKSFLALVHAGAIKNFLARYNSEIKEIRAELSEMRKAFFVTNEEGKIKMRFDLEAQQNVPVLLEGKTVKEWNEAWESKRSEVVPEKVKLVKADGKTLVN